MSEERIAQRDRALRALEALAAALGAEPEAGRWDEAVETCDQLRRAVAAFHLEAIRFRMYTLRRVLRLEEPGAPERARGPFEELQSALVAAGFTVR